jgi:predicted amidophosphoribosyltransferase
MFFPSLASVASALRGFLAALVDLVLPEACVACDAPGAVLCGTCRATLSGVARVVWPTPPPTGLPPPYGVSDYAGVARAAILAHKEDGCFSLAAPLGAALAASVRVAVAATYAPSEPVVLVPVPSSRAAVRARGHDPLARIAQESARIFRASGVDARVAPVLRVRRRVADQAGLGSAQRAVNLASAMTVRETSWFRRLGFTARDLPLPRRCLLVDDVMTTGATLTEAARALRSAGIEVPAAAVIAATVRTGLVRLPADRASFDYTTGHEAASVSSWHPPGSVVALPERA